MEPNFDMSNSIPSKRLKTEQKKKPRTFQGCEEGVKSNFDFDLLFPLVGVSEMDNGVSYLTFTLA